MYGVQRTGVRLRDAAIYDIVTPDPATAWPATEASSDYPTSLFEDPRSALVSPVLRASYALVGEQETPGEHGALTGLYIALADGADDTSRQQSAARVLATKLFYSASRFRIIEGDPEPPEWLEIFETDQRDPLNAHAQSLDKLTPWLPDAEIQPRRSGSFRLVSAYPARQRSDRGERRIDTAG
jgi:hypothetical protein